MLVMTRLLGALVVLLVLASAVPAWWNHGHENIAEGAAAILPEDVPAFFRAGGKRLAHYAVDPDRWKNRTALQLRSAESPDHFSTSRTSRTDPSPTHAGKRS